MHFVDPQKSCCCILRKHKYFPRRALGTHYHSRLPEAQEQGVPKVGFVHFWAVAEWRVFRLEVIHTVQRNKFDKQNDPKPENNPPFDASPNV